MFIPDPDFYPTRIRISDPVLKNSYKREGVQKFVVIPYFVVTNFTKFKIILNCRRKKFGQITKNYRTFTQKLVTKLSKI